MKVDCRLPSQQVLIRLGRNLTDMEKINSISIIFKSKTEATVNPGLYDSVHKPNEAKIFPDHKFTTGGQDVQLFLSMEFTVEEKHYGRYQCDITVVTSGGFVTVKLITDIFKPSEITSSIGVYGYKIATPNPIEVGDTLKVDCRLPSQQVLIRLGHNLAVMKNINYISIIFKTKIEAIFNPSLLGSVEEPNAPAKIFPDANFNGSGKDLQLFLSMVFTFEEKHYGRYQCDISVKTSGGAVFVELITDIFKPKPTSSPKDVTTLTNGTGVRNETTTKVNEKPGTDLMVWFYIVVGVTAVVMVMAGVVLLVKKAVSGSGKPASLSSFLRRSRRDNSTVKTATTSRGKAKHKQPSLSTEETSDSSSSSDSSESDSTFSKN